MNSRRNKMEACQSCFCSLSKLNINGETEFVWHSQIHLTLIFTVVLTRWPIKPKRLDLVLSLYHGIKNKSTLAVPWYSDGIRCNTVELWNIPWCIYDIFLHCIPMYFNKYCKMTVELVQKNNNLVLQSDHCTMIPPQFSFFVMEKNISVISLTWISLPWYILRYLTITTKKYYGYYMVHMVLCYIIFCIIIFFKVPQYYHLYYIKFYSTAKVLFTWYIQGVWKL